jgi:hypothetical protein
MENVQFEKSQEESSFEINHVSKTGLVTRVFIKLGLAKNQKQANTVMITVSILCLLLMSYFITSTFHPNALNFIE